MKKSWLFILLALVIVLASFYFIKENVLFSPLRLSYSKGLQLEKAPNSNNLNTQPYDLLLRNYIQSYTSNGSDNRTGPPGYKHGTYPTQESKYFPPDWIHDPDGAEPSIYYPPGSVHITEGELASRYQFPPSEHIEKGPFKTENVPPWWKHIDDGPKMSWYYPPEYFYHADMPGPYYTQLVPLNFKHVSEGPLASHYLPLDDMFHIPDGPWASYYAPDGYVHVEGSWYVPAGATHIPDGKEASSWYFEVHRSETSSMQIIRPGMPSNPVI
jgi:hypothetical protein